MFFQGYNPDFWKQEFVEKILQENFPGAKVNDITACHIINFHDIPVVTPAKSLYYGYVHSYDDSLMELAVLDLTSGLITIETAGFDFPLLIIAEVTDIPCLFTGWKISVDHNFSDSIPDDPEEPGAGIFVSEFNPQFV